MPNEIFDALAPLVNPDAPKPPGPGAEEPAWVRWLKPVVESPFSAAERRRPGEAQLPTLDAVGSNEIAESLAPLVNPGRLQLQEQYLDRARARVKDQGEGVVGYLSKRIVPFGSSVVGNIEQQRYADALQRYQKGAADEKDIHTIAAAERLTTIDQQRNIAEKAAAAATHLPAVLGEAYVGGGLAGRLGFAAKAAPEVGSLLTREGVKAAVRQAPGAAARQAALTPAMPSVWLEESAQNAAQKGGDWYDPENVVPALAHGALQNAVLGSAGKFANRAPGGLAGRAGVGAVVMPMESAAADAFAGVVDDTVMPDAYKLRTRYGTLGQIARGETDDALKRVVVEALTGAAFSAFHGRDHAPQLAELHAALHDAADAGATRDEAAKSVAQMLGRPATREPEPGGGVLGRRKSGESTPLTSNEPPPPAETVIKGPEAAPGTEPAPTPAGPEIAPQRAAGGDSLLPGRPERDAALQAAQEQVQAGRPAVYVDMDVNNMKGAAGAIGDAGATGHARRMAVAVGEELARIPGAEVKVFRHAGDPQGDEHSAVVVGATKPQVDAALRAAESRVADLSRAAGLAEVPHPKGEGRPAGVGMATFAEALVPGRPWKHTVTEAEAGTESVKARRVPEAPAAPPTKAERMAAFLAKGKKNAGLTPDQLGLKPAEAPRATRDAMVDAWQGWSLPVHEAELHLREMVGRLLDKGFVPIPEDARAAINGLMEKAQLPAHLRHVLEQRLLDKTLQEVGDNWPFNAKKMLTRERIRQLEGQALDQLGIDRSVAAAVFAPEKAEGKRRLARKVKTPEGAVAETEVPEKEGRRGKDALQKAQDEHDAAQDQLIKVLEKIKLNGGKISAEDQSIIDRALATGEREGQVSQGGPATAADEAAGGGGRPPRGAANPPAAGKPGGAGPGLGQAGQGPVPLPAAAAGAGPVPAQARNAKSLGNLKQNREPVSAVGRVVKRGGISPESAANYWDVAAIKGTKLERVFKDATGRKSTRHIDDVLDELVSDRQLVPNDREHRADTLLGILRGKARFAEDIESAAGQRSLADAEGRRHAAEHAQAIDEHASFLQEWEGVDRTQAEAMAERFLAERVAFNMQQPIPEGMGAASRGFTPQSAGTLGRLIAEHVKTSAVRFVQGVQDFAGRLGGQIAPVTSRFSEAAGNAIARLGASRHFARELTPFLLDRILPPGAGLADRLKLGAVMTELRLRHMRTQFWLRSEAASNAGVAALQRAQAAATPKEKAAAKSDAAEQFKLANEFREKSQAVVSLVGGSFKDQTVQYPLPDEAAFRQLAADPAVLRQVEAYKRHAVPVMERYFRLATGLAEGEGIESMTQLGDMPISLVVRQEGEETPTTVFFGTSRGKVGAHSLHRLGASREASGAAGRGYELDLGTILEKMAGDRVPLGAKAEAFRVWEKEGVGRWGEPGDSIGVDGVTWKKMPKVDPPKGSQAAEKGQTAFFVDPRFWGEVHQALGLNEPPGRVPFSSVLSKLTLASTVEAAYHSRNLLTMLTRPGFNPADAVRHAYRLATRDPATMKAVLDLAEIGAMKEHGFEAPVFMGKYNPLARFQEATGKFLSVVDRAVRLSAADAFDRVAKRDGVENTERAKRDFINQAGNYSKLTQSRIVAWLRDTGLGPFATAGSNFYVQGLRGLTGSHGIRTTSYKADLRLRAEMLLRMAVLPAAAAAVNYALWGRVDGDDKTPLFGLKVGTDEKGRTSYLDLGGLTGVTRGMRETGMQALAESMRPGAKKAGATPSDAFDRGVSDAALAVLHPAIGPPVSFVHTALTGKNTLGGQVAPKADMKKGESQAERNIWAALWQTNPVLESYAEPYANRLAGFKEKREESLQERAMKMFGPFGVKTRGEAPGAPHRQMTIPVPASPQQRQELKARQQQGKATAR